MQKHTNEHEKLTNLKAQVRESKRKSRELIATVRKPEEIEKKKGTRERERREKRINGRRERGSERESQLKTGQNEVLVLNVGGGFWLLAFGV